MIAQCTRIIKSFLAKWTFVLEQPLVEVDVVLQFIFPCKGLSTLWTHKRSDFKMNGLYVLF